MTIIWYPGHMHKAQKQIRAVISEVDLVIEVIDARIPFSSENPMVGELCGARPCIKILNKADLADPDTTRRWVDHFTCQKGVRANALSATEKGVAHQVIKLCREMVPLRADRGDVIRAMIMGIPNVGKSTLINTLAGKAIAKVGNEPAVTRQQQRISLGSGVVLFDTPGILWPRMEDENSGYRLAVTGAIKNSAISFEEIARYAAGLLLQRYPQSVVDRYQLEEQPANDTALLEAVGRKRGCLRAGGHIDLHKASEVLLNDLRAGRLGQISLELPSEDE